MAGYVACLQRFYFFWSPRATLKGLNSLLPEEMILSFESSPFYAEVYSIINLKLKNKLKMGGRLLHIVSIFHGIVV